MTDHRPALETSPAATPRRAARSTLAVAALVVAAALGLAACSSSPSAGSGGPAATSEHVVIQNFAFSPANFTVKPGATITVTNKDQVAHTFSATGGQFNTGNIGPGQTKTVHAPTKAGSYSYKCLIHQYMTGTLTVS